MISFRTNYITGVQRDRNSAPETVGLLRMVVTMVLEDHGASPSWRKFPSTSSSWTPFQCGNAAVQVQVPFAGFRGMVVSCVGKQAMVKVLSCQLKESWDEVSGLCTREPEQDCKKRQKRGNSQSLSWHWRTLNWRAHFIEWWGRLLGWKSLHACGLWRKVKGTLCKALIFFCQRIGRTVKEGDK